MLLRLDSSPPSSTSHTASVSVSDLTLNESRPLLTRIVSPTARDCVRLSSATLTPCSSPAISRVVNVNSSPVLSVTRPFSNVLMRYSGPRVSSMMATGSPSLSRTRRMRRIRSRCSSCVPWEKFSLATFMPARQSASSVASSSLAGPMVQMIFVLRMGIPPGKRVNQERVFDVGGKESGSTADV